MASLPVSAVCFPHQKIFEDRIPFAAGEWRAATTALDLAVNRVKSGFDFDHAIERVAARAIERVWLVCSHDTPRHLLFACWGSLRRRFVDGKYCHQIVAKETHTAKRIAVVPTRVLEKPRWCPSGAFSFCRLE
jgi:hypothetical protein